MRAGATRMAACAFAIGAFSARRLDAAPACSVHFEATGAPTPEWTDALRDLEGFVRDAPGDCASIDVIAAADGAEVDLRTRDGRQAHRRILRPDELNPLVRALLVAGPPDSPSTEQDDVTPTPAPPASWVTTPSERTVASPKDGPALTASAGAGLALPSAVEAAPLVQLGGGVVTKAWELGAFGRWELEHVVRDDHDAGHTSLGSVGGGAAIGYRREVAPVTLVLGATLGAYSVEVEHARPHRGAATERTETYVLDPRGGLQLACVVPVTAAIRSRLQLGGELAVLDHSDVPRWHLGLTLGVEIGRAP